MPAPPRPSDRAPRYSEPVCDDGQVLCCVEKQVLEDVSQQLVPPFATAGQLLWQSVSAAQVDGHALPPPVDEPLDEPPDDVPPLDEELLL